MRWMFALAFLFSASASAAGPDQPAERLEAEAHGTLTIEPDGRVSEVTLPDALEEPLRGVFVDAIKAWTFEPVTVDGRVVRAVAHMELGLYLSLRGKALTGAGIERVVFIDPPATAESTRREGLSMRPPRYPQSLAARGIGGRVLLQVQTDSSGRVQRVATRDGALFAFRDGATEQSIRTAFEELAEASERAARRWTVPGCIDSCVVPIIYSVGARSSFWRPVLDVPFVPEPWVLDGDAPTALTASGAAPSQRFRPTKAIEGVDLLPDRG